MQGDLVLFSSVGLWEAFLGVKITRVLKVVWSNAPLEHMLPG